MLGTAALAARDGASDIVWVQDPGAGNVPVERYSTPIVSGPNFLRTAPLLFGRVGVTR